MSPRISFPASPKDVGFGFLRRGQQWDRDSLDVGRWQSDPKTKEIAKDIISVWYSGLTGQGDKQRVITHESALAWRATGYAKPPGTCGEFGDWTARPAGSSVLEVRP